MCKAADVLTSGPTESDEELDLDDSCGTPSYFDRQVSKTISTISELPPLSEFKPELESDSASDIFVTPPDSEAELLQSDYEFPPDL